MPQVPPPVVKERARRLREACARRRRAWLEGQTGTRQRVLVEKDGIGHAENFAPVQTRCGDGEIVDLRITSLANDLLVGVPA
jgi:threonylcarbamoyladenosine tRNA methylthiotransferase MtaB